MMWLHKHSSWTRRSILFMLAIVLSGAFAFMVACTSDDETETAIIETAEPEVKAVTDGTQSEPDPAEKVAIQRPPTFTRTPTFTVTSTFTPTATHTPVPTDTPSPQPTPTHTPPATPTHTPVPTPTNTPTPVPIPTETPVPPTPTPPPTATATPTLIPTDTPTPIPTDTPPPTATPTPEPTIPPTAEPTATFSPTPPPTPTPEPSPTPTSTPEPTAIPSPTLTPTVTPTPTPEKVSNLTLRWVFHTDVTGSIANTASDADLTVRDGVVYAGSKDNKIYAIYASSGQEKWSYNAGSDVTSGGVLSEDGAILYFGTDHSGFFALDTDDGSRRWCYRCDDDDRSDSFETKPTVYEDMVIAPAHGRVYAFNTDTESEDEGKLLWANPRIVQDLEEWRFQEPGIAYRDAFYIGNSEVDSDGTLWGFHTDTGGRNGNARLRGTQMPYCREDEDCRNGDEDLEPLRTAVVRNGRDIYFGNDAGELIQYTGNSINWVFTTSSKRNVRGDIAATDESVVFADRSGAIYAVNPDPEEATKKDEDLYKVPERLWIESTVDQRWIAGGPVISGEYVYVIDSHGLLYMIDLERGKTRYTMSLWSGDGPCVSCKSTPAIEDDMLFVGTKDGTIVGVQLPIYVD